MAQPRTFLIQFVSLVAILFSLAAVLDALFRVINKVWTWLMMTYHYDRHVIICGLSRKGFHLARAFGEGNQLVVIEQDLSNPAISILRLEGYRVHVGDATSKATLLKAGAHKASRIIATCDDETNFNILNATQDLLREKSARITDFHLHVGDDQLFTELQYSEVSSRVPDSASPAMAKGIGRIGYFNLSRIAAERLVDHVPEGLAQPPSPTIAPGATYLIVGDSALAAEFIVQVTRAWCVTIALEPSPGNYPAFHVVAPNARRFVGALLAAHPKLLRQSQFTTCDIELSGEEFERGDFLKNGSGANIAEPTRVVVNLGSDLKTVTASLAILRHVIRLRWENALIIACILEEQGVFWCETLSKNNTPWCRQLQPFNILRYCLAVDFGRHVNLDQIAISLQSAYLRQVESENNQRMERGQQPFTLQEKPANLPWELLEERFRESLRQQAHSIAQSLRKLPHPARIELSDGQSIQFNNEEIELLAIQEHKRWDAEKLLNGWTYAPKRDDTALQHPDMVPWSDLSEPSKDYDRNMAKQWPAALKNAGLAIRRVQE